jgi:hypothetical protein
MVAEREEARTEERLVGLQRNIRAAMNGTAAADVTRNAGLRPSDLRRLLQGGTADLSTVAKLEAYFERSLWPTRADAARRLNGRETESLVPDAPARLEKG